MTTLPNRLISLLSDYGFKITFANEKNQTFLRKAIQLLTKSEIDIKTLQHLPTEFEGISEEARKGFYDTLCLVNKELYFILEMQLGNHTYLIERLLFYAAQLYIAQVVKGLEGFADIKKIHCICITRDTLFPDEHPYYHNAAIKTETGKIISDKIEFILVELKKFTKLAHETENELDELLFTMKNADTIDISKPEQIPHFWKKEWLQDVVKELNLSTMSPMNRALYNISVARLVAINEQFELDMKVVADKTKKEVTESVTKEVTESITKELKIKGIEKALKRGKLTIAEIAEDEEVPVAFVLQVKANLKHN